MLLDNTKHTTSERKVGSVGYRSYRGMENDDDSLELSFPFRISRKILSSNNIPEIRKSPIDVSPTGDDQADGSSCKWYEK